jgi:hypothetical protein
MDDDWNESRIDVIGQNGNEALHYGWLKHDGSFQCPVESDAIVEIETWTKSGNVIKPAHQINWLCVKFYKIIKDY